MLVMRVLFSFFILILSLSCTSPSDKISTIEIRNHSFSWNKKGKCDLVITQNNDSVIVKAMGKFRGGVSSKYPKHSFTIELDDKFKFNNLQKDDDWIFNAAYIDKTFMRHKISYDLFRLMNKNNKAPEVSYFNLKIDGKYQGLYQLMEKIDASFLNLNKQDSLTMLFKGPPFLYEKKLPLVQDSNNYFHQKYPKLEKSNKSFYIEHFKSFLFYSSDSVFTENISNWVDIENIMDWHLLLLFSFNDDGIMKNFYLYKSDNLSPIRIAIWDYDHSFGRDGDGELNMMERFPNFQKSILFTRLMEIDKTGYRQALKKRWFELRNLEIFSRKKFNSMIEENEKLFINELPNNFAKWPINSHYYYDSSTYVQEIQIMKDFVDLRLPYLDNYFKTLE